MKLLFSMVWSHFSNMSLINKRVEEISCILYQHLRCTGGLKVLDSPSAEGWRRGHNLHSKSTHRDTPDSHRFQTSSEELPCLCVCHSLWKPELGAWGLIITGFIHAPFIFLFKSDFNKVRWNTGTDRVLFLLCGSLLPLRLLSVHRCQSWTVWVLGSLLLHQIKEICLSYKVPNNVLEVKVPQSGETLRKKHWTELKRNDYSNLAGLCFPWKLPDFSC